MSQQVASISRIPFFGRSAKRPINDSSVDETSPKKKRQATITSFFQVPGCDKPTKVEFTDVTVKKKHAVVAPLKGAASFPTPKEQEAAVIQCETPVLKGCPFYKRIPDTTFVVDAFSYGSIPGVKHYFLSHFHSDHYNGLTKRFAHPIYCTQITANLIFLKMGLPRKFINVCSVKEPFILNGVGVQLFDANHCPGSVMFLFDLPDGRRFLHTGDFRATSDMTTCSRFINVDSLYLDTTYLDPQYTFPSQDEVVRYVANLVASKLAFKPKTLIVCGSYTIGKERLFLAIAKMCNLKICATANKRRVLRCLEDEFLNGCLLTNWNCAQIHVLSMFDLTFPKLHAHLSGFKDVFDEVVAFRPTGWAYQKLTTNGDIEIVPRRSGCIALYDVPYSEHSSFLELKQFVQTIRPRKVVPTVYGNLSKMNVVFKDWLNR